MKYKKIIAGISAILMCAVSIPFATAFADGDQVAAVTGIDDSVSTYAAYKAGDANVDGKITVADAVKASRYAVGLDKGDGYSVSEINAAITAGVDKTSGKAKVTAEDAVEIAKHIIGSASGALTINVKPTATLKLPAGKSTIVIYVGKDKAGTEGVNGGYGYGNWTDAEQGTFEGIVDANGYLTFDVDLAEAVTNFQVQLYYVNSDTTYTDKNVSEVKIGIPAKSEPSTEDTTASTEESTEGTTASTEPSTEGTTAPSEPSTEGTTASSEPSTEPDSKIPEGSTEIPLKAATDNKELDFTGITTGKGKITLVLSGPANSIANVYYGYQTSTWEQNQLFDQTYDADGNLKVEIDVTESVSSLKFACYYSKSGEKTDSYHIGYAYFTPAE